MDDLNNPVGCDPVIGGLQTADNRIFTTTVTPQTSGVDHSYRLTLTVEAGSVSSSVGSKPNEEPEAPLEMRVSPPGAPEPISTLSLSANGSHQSVRLSWNRPSDNGGSAIIRYEYRYAGDRGGVERVAECGSGGERGDGGRFDQRPGVCPGGPCGQCPGQGRELKPCMATPVVGGGGFGGGGGGGGGGGLLFPPGAPKALTGNGRRRGGAAGVESTGERRRLSHPAL